MVNQVNVKDPKLEVWNYPKEEDVYFFDCISAVGSKWKPLTDSGSDAQPTEINQQIEGTVSMFVNWNKLTVKAKRVDVGIE